MKNVSPPYGQSFQDPNAEIETATDVLNYFIDMKYISRFDPNGKNLSLNINGHSKSYVYKFTTRSSFQEKRVLPYTTGVRLVSSITHDNFVLTLFLIKLIHEKFIKKFYQKKAGYSRTGYYIATKDVDFLGSNLSSFIEFIVNELMEIRSALATNNYSGKQIEEICSAIYSNPLKLLHEKLLSSLKLEERNSKD